MKRTLFSSTTSVLVAAQFVWLMTGVGASAMDWDMTRVDEREGFFHSLSLAVSPDGTVFVSYIRALSPPNQTGEVYVAKRVGFTWTRTLVAPRASGWGTTIALNPVDGQPGVLYENLGAIQLREFDGTDWVLETIPAILPVGQNSLAYGADGSLYISGFNTAVLDGAGYYFNRLLCRQDTTWREIPQPVQADWANLCAHGTELMLAGVSQVRGQPGLRLLDVLRHLPQSYVVETVDRLPPEALDGEISVRTPSLAVHADGSLQVVYAASYLTAAECITELRVVTCAGDIWGPPEVILGGGSVSDPEGFAAAQEFESYVSAGPTLGGSLYIFGNSADMKSVSYAGRRGGQWIVERIVTAGTAGGLWRGRAAGLDPITNTPILIMANGSQWRVDSVPYLAQMRLTAGDANCDGLANGGDISAFVLAILDSATYAVDFPDCHRSTIDINGDGQIDESDVGAFAALLTSP